MLWGAAIHLYIHLPFENMSSMPCQLNEATANAPHFGNLELFQADLDMEEVNLEQIQHDVTVKIAAVRIHNEKICQDWEDQKLREGGPEEGGGRRMEEERR